MFRNTAIQGATLVLGVLLVACGPKYPNCEQDKHCNEGEYCVNNLCQQCRDNGDCPEGQECEAGACREIPGYCTQSTDCAQGQVCRDNRCGPCLSAGDCKGGQVCMSGICGEAECRADDDCPAGLNCVNYRCETDSEANGTLGNGDCVVEPIYFDFDSSELNAEARGVIASNYECLSDRSGKISLVGHCDSRGTTEYNMALGERRAGVVHKVMKTLGYDASKLRVTSKGKEEATGTDEASWARDRRVEFK